MLFACASILLTGYHLIKSRAAFGIFDAFVLVILVAQVVAFGFTFGQVAGAIRSRSASRLNRVFLVQVSLQRLCGLVCAVETSAY